jgi:hypothetical protein
MPNKCKQKDCNNSTPSIGMCISHSVSFKAYCKTNNYCVRCTYENKEKPTVLSKDGLLCPHCDYDEYSEDNKEVEKKQKVDNPEGK